MKLTPAIYKATLIKVLKPQFYMCRALGLAPFTHDLQPSRPAALYSLLLVVLIPLGVGVCNFDYYRYLLYGVVNMQTFVTATSSTLTSGLAAFFSILMALTRTRSNFAELLKNLYKVDVILARSREVTDYMTMRKFIFIESFLLCLFFILSGTLNQQSFHLATLHFYVYLSYYMSVNYVTLAQFFNLVHYIKMKYRAINATLESTFDTQATGSTELEATEQPVAETTDMLPLYQVYSRVRKIHIASQKHTDVEKVATVKGLRQAHYLLHIVIDHLNKLFGLRMTGLLLFLLVDTVASTYLLLKRAQTFEFKMAEVFLLLAPFVALVKDVLMLLTVTIGCHLAMQEVHLTPTLVQLCLLTDGLGAQVKLELQQFAQQMLTTSPVFSACGLFELDISLLLGVSASVATYTVILMTAK